jgi:hypothetical protein
MSAFHYDENGYLAYDCDQADWEREQREQDRKFEPDPDYRHPLRRALEDDPTGDF